MEIALDAVRISAFASQETCCFEAVVMIDGARQGTVRNQGTGGMNVYHPPALRERLSAIAKTLPPFEFDGVSLDHDADTVVAMALDAWEDAARVRRGCLVV